MASTKVVAAIKASGFKKMDIMDRTALEQELNELKAQLVSSEPGAGDSARPDLLQDKPGLIKKIKSIEESLNKDDDLIATGDNDRAKLSARKKEIEAIITKEMPTARQQALRETAGRDFNKAVEQTMMHQRKYGALMNEWQDIMKRLEPNDPDAWSTTNLIP